MNKNVVRLVVLNLILVLSLLGLASIAAATQSGSQRLATSASVAQDHCPPLSEPTGNIVNVSSEAELWSAVNSAQEGDTILLADGTYNLGQNGHYLWIDTPNVTLRSASGNREAVILDDNYSGSEIVSIIASNVTIADLTIKRAWTHPIHVTSSDSGDTLNTLIYNVHIIDPREQAIKINPHSAKVNFPDYGVVACSHIELTDEGRPHVNPTSGGCYTGGVDAHYARGWVIRDNVIEGFWCPSGLSEHGVHMWRGCRDTVVERNVFIDNARGVGFGLMTSGSARTYGDNPCPEAEGGYVGHYGGIIRNNFIFASRSELFLSAAGFDCGICLWNACGAQVLHNTVASTQVPASSSIEWRFDNADPDVINNLVTHNLLEREGATASTSGNLDAAPLSLFVDGASGDLHLADSASAAIDQAVTLAAGLCDDDIDGDPRPIGSARDIGADEYRVAAPTAVTDLLVTDAVTSTGTLTATLRWTAPTTAVTTTLRYSATSITESNWASASLLTNDLPGSSETFTATVLYGDAKVYFALKTQNAEGVWSDLSNNAVWFVPVQYIFLPVLIRGG
jgi:hypothetical protein